MDLGRLLNPRSVALVGASAKANSLGSDMLRVLRRGGYPGEIYPVNPAYEAIDGLACFPSLTDLPAVPDLVVMGVGASRIEAALEQAIAIETGGAVVFDSCYAQDDGDSKLLDRLKAIAGAAAFPVCGGNGMGFYNFESSAYVSFQASQPRPAGHIAAVVHSGSVFVHLANNDPRYRFNLIVSPGQEIHATAADYIEHALSLPSTRVVALFLETVRDPAGFVRALEKANACGIPIVALKVARTAQSAALAQTHSAAIAGNDAAFEAVFARHGVLRVSDLDELMSTAQLLASPKKIGKGGLGALTDSGGLRELLVDLAVDHAVPFSPLSNETESRLEKILPPGLAPANPVDGAGPLNANYAAVFDRSCRALLDDDGVALLAFEFEVRDDFSYMPDLIAAAEAAAAYSDKPVIVFSSIGSAQNRAIAERLLGSGVPLINGVQNLLKSVRHALAWRDFCAEAAGRDNPAEVPSLPPEWARWNGARQVLGEAESYALLEHFGVAVAPFVRVSSSAEAVSGSDRLGYPVVLKTASEGVVHKSDVGGVRLNLASRDAVGAAYADLAARLGPEALVQKMVSGVELAYGMIRDEQFGTIVVLGSGGTNIELFADRQVALAPVAPAEALAMLRKLRVAKLLEGYRGAPPTNLAAVAESFSRYSAMAAALGPSVVSLDINPVIVRGDDCVAADAVVVLGPSSKEGGSWRR